MPAHLAKSAPDGYIIMMGYAVPATNALFNPKLPYDTLKDFQPLVGICELHPAGSITGIK